MVGSINEPNLKAAHLGGFFVALNCIRTSICYANQKQKNEIVVIRNRISYIPRNIEKKGESNESTQDAAKKKRLK